MKNNTNKPLSYNDGRERDAIGRALRGAPQQMKKGGKANKGNDTSGLSGEDLATLNAALGTNYKKLKDVPKSAIAQWKSIKDDTKSSADDNFKPNDPNDYLKSGDYNKDFRTPNVPIDMKEFQKNAAGAVNDVVNQTDWAKDRILNLGKPGESDLTKDSRKQVAGIDSLGTDALDKAAQIGYDVNDQYKGVKNYNKTGYGDIEQKAGDLSQYDPAQFSSSDYTNSDLAQRMSPYEELVAERGRQRLKKDYEEGRGQRELEAQRSGAFGGSEAAIKEMADRNNYRTALDDMNAQSLQNAYTSAGQLTQFADDSRNRAETGDEQSRQYGAGLGMQGLEAQKSARDAAANETARAKEAEISGVAGQGSTGQYLAGIGSDQLNMELSKIDAKNTMGQQDQQYRESAQEYPLDTLQKAQNIYATGVSGTPMNQTPKPSSPSNLSTALGYASTGASILGSLGGASGVGSAIGGIGSAIGGMFKDGGYIEGMADGGMTQPIPLPAPPPPMQPMQPQVPPLMLNLANGGIVDLHRAIFRR